MLNRITGDIPVIEFELLHDQKNLIHFITTRSGGCSINEYYSLNLSNQVGDLAEHVVHNRRRVMDAYSILPARMHFPEQCHSTYIHEITDDTTQVDLMKTDALITNRRNHCITVLTADCVPILFYDPEVRAIGVAHSGWKGTVGRIVLRTIERMISKYGCKPHHILACMGPCISQKNYEVGEEVVRKFEFWFADTPGVFSRDPGTGKTHLNLWEANRQLLLRNGLQDKNIEVSGICTFDNKDLFFSARRDGMQSGRFATAMMLT